MAAGEPQRQVTLYSRTGCHLCEQAHDIVARIGRRHGVTFEIVLIDADPALQARYDTTIPVVQIGARELAWPFSERDIESAMRAL